MTDDPIVGEVRKAGQAYIDSFHGDLEAVMPDLRRGTEEARRAGQAVASPPPRPSSRNLSRRSSTSGNPPQSVSARRDGHPGTPDWSSKIMRQMRSI